MSYYQLLRLIVRGWWRNKLFTVVAWGSLVIGILCVSLLGAFVLHEYHVDKAIPDGERILRLTQQVSMGKQAETTFKLLPVWRNVVMFRLYVGMRRFQ